jgi:hypothetical protein
MPSPKRGASNLHSARMLTAASFLFSVTSEIADAILPKGPTTRFFIGNARANFKTRHGAIAFRVRDNRVISDVRVQDCIHLL